MHIKKATQATILLVEPDNDMRHLLVDNLRSKGFRVIVTVDAQGALAWVESQQDLEIILINQFDQPLEDCLKVGNSIRQQYAQENSIALVILAEHYSSDREGQNLQMEDNTYVTYLEDGQQLFDLLFDILPLNQRL